VRPARILAGVAVAASMASCSCSGVPVTVAPAPPEGYVLTGPAKGTACAMMPWSISRANNRAQLAYQRALESAGATGLTDTKVSERWAHRVIGLTLCTTIEGVGFKTTE
jgi:hypothetical protein